MLNATAILISIGTRAVHVRCTIDGLPGEHAVDMPLDSFLPHIQGDTDALIDIFQTTARDVWEARRADVAHLPEMLANVVKAREAHAASEEARATAEAAKAVAERDEFDAKERKKELENQHAEIEAKIAELQAQTAEVIVAKNLAGVAG
jgi:hypothetical protein